MVCDLSLYSNPGRYPLPHGIFNDAEGVVFIGKAQEKAPVFRTEKRRSPNGQSYPWIVRSTAMVNQLHLCRRP